MAKAVVQLNEIPTRNESFARGLKALGYEVLGPARIKELGAGDLFVTWNRYHRWHTTCVELAKRGVIIVVAENGYLGQGSDGGKLFAMALDHHNGAGRWPQERAPGRFAKFGVTILPWRERGEHLLLLPQRGIGAPGVAMPHTWLDSAKAICAKRSKRPVRIRRHPGKVKSHPLEPEFKNCWAALTWGSGAALKALAHGIPVFSSFPQWIGASAASPLDMDTDFENPYLGGRVAMFERLAWAQYERAEVESGFAFRNILG